MVVAEVAVVVVVVLLVVEAGVAAAAPTAPAAAVPPAAATDAAVALAAAKAAAVVLPIAAAADIFFFSNSIHSVSVDFDDPACGPFTFLFIYCCLCYRTIVRVRQYPHHKTNGRILQNAHCINSLKQTVASQTTVHE